MEMTTVRKEEEADVDDSAGRIAAAPILSGSRGVAPRRCLEGPRLWLAAAEDGASGGRVVR